jgi:hypothetical protein
MAKPTIYYSHGSDPAFLNYLDFRLKFMRDGLIQAQEGISKALMLWGEIHASLQAAREKEDNVK